MLSRQSSHQIICLLLGFVVAAFAVHALGYTFAIAAPGAYLEWFQSRGWLKAGLLLWDSTVVFGIGLGLPVCIALLASFRLLALSKLLCAGCFLTGLLLTAYVLVPLLHGTPWSDLLVRPWWALGMEVSLALAVLIAVVLGHWFWPSKRLHSAADQAGVGSA